MGLEPEFEEFWKNTDFLNSNDTVILYSYLKKASHNNRGTPVRRKTFR
jgi:hypothetical protein